MSTESLSVRARTSALVALSLSVCGLLLLTHANRASAAQLECGDTITEDTTLSNDLVDCPHNGIVIGADDVTLDLRGHLVDGDGGCGGGDFCDRGIVVRGRSGTVIRGGDLREFDAGFFIRNSRHTRIRRIEATANVFFGVIVIGSNHGLIRASHLSRNVPPEGDGLGLFDSHDISVVNNEIRQNAGPGVHLGGSDGNRVALNSFRADGPAVLIEGSRNEIGGNTVRAGDGIVVGPGDRNVIARNVLKHVADSIAVEKGRGNVVKGNLVTDPDGTGIRLGIGMPFIGGGHNRVRNNVVRGSSEDAFHVYGKDGHSLLKGNVAVRAGKDGFDVDNATTTLTANRATRNAELGIEAVGGTVDGGRNVARRNGDPRQCINVRCR